MALEKAKRSANWRFRSDDWPGGLAALILDCLPLLCRLIQDLLFQCVGFIYSLNLGIEYPIFHLVLIGAAVAGGTAERKSK
jgi:hypothetical protein